MTKNKDLTPEDKSLWDAYKKKVDRLKKEEEDDKPAPLSRPKPTKPQKVTTVTPTRTATKQPSQNLKSTISRQRLRKLNIEAEVDLHGMTQAQAHQTLIHFITRCHHAGKKAVLVITGKGLRKQMESGGQEGGVLRQAVPKWLNVEPLRSMVSSYTESAIKDGGSGALYVFLRKKK